MQPEKIYVVFKTHVDLGFTDLPSAVVNQYKQQMMDDVLNVCEATAGNRPGHRYVWTLPAWMLIQCLDQQDPERKERLNKLVQDGQLCWHGLPFTTHTEFCGVEEYLRGLAISEQLSNQYGKEVISAKMTDVPGHTWMLPSLLAQAGIRFLHLGVNACSAPVELPRLFWWEGPDGSRVLTWYSAGEYGTSLLPPDDWEYPIWFALMQTHDNIGPQGSEIVTQLLDDVAAKYPDAEVHLGTMDDFARDFLDRGYDDLPVIRKDLSDSWIHGVGTYPGEVSKVRQLRYDLAAKESLATLREGGLQTLDAVSLIRQGFEQTLLFGEHTWGIDIKSNLLPGRHEGRAFGAQDAARDRAAFPDTYDKTERSWEEQRNYVRKAERLSEQTVPAASPEPDALMAVFNPLPSSRTHAGVQLNVAKSGFLQDPDSGERFPVDREGRGTVGRIEPLATRHFIWRPDTAGGTHEEPPFAPCRTDAVLENEALRIQVEAQTGRIVSLFDKQAGKEWADDGFGTYRYDLFGKTDILKFVKEYAYDMRDWYVNDFGKPGYPRIPGRTFQAPVRSVAARRTAAGQEVRIVYGADPESRGEFGNAAAAELTITLQSDREGADFSLRLLDKQPTAFSEAGYFVLPLKARRPQYRLQKMGAVVDPLQDIQRGANFRLHCIDQWLDVEDGDGAGLAVFPLDTPLSSLGEPGVYRYDPEYRPQAPVVYFNLFNNQWGTNFPQWIGGDFTYRFRIVPHVGNWKQAGLETLAEELRQPLLAYVPATAGEQSDHPESPLLTEPVANVRWLAVKKPDNGEPATIVRWMNAADEPRVMTVRFNPVYTGITRCNGVEREIEPLQVIDGAVTIQVRPFEIVTLKLRR